MQFILFNSGHIFCIDQHRTTLIFFLYSLYRVSFVLNLTACFVSPFVFRLSLLLAVFWSAVTSSLVSVSSGCLFRPPSLPVTLAISFKFEIRTSACWLTGSCAASCLVLLISRLRTQYPPSGRPTSGCLIWLAVSSVCLFQQSAVSFICLFQSL